MSINQEDIPLRWEIINRLIHEYWSDDEEFISFNIEEKKAYSLNEIEKMKDEGTTEYELFSNLIHQIPRSSVFKSSDILLWKEYQKIFFCGTIPRPASDYAIDEELEVDDKKLEKYLQFERDYEEIETKYVSALEAETSENEVEKLLNRLKLKRKAWVNEGFKTYIEEKRNQAFSEGIYSYATQWSQWKTEAEDSWLASTRNPDHTFGKYEANFDVLLDDNWEEDSFKHHQIKEIINSDTIHRNDEVRSHVVEEIDSIRFKFRKLSINREWFNKDVFKARFWKWKDSYDGGLLSDGYNPQNGSCPSFIKEVIFIKDIQFRERSNVVFDFLEWVGGDFTELEYDTFLKTPTDNILLIGYVCEMLPLSPNPDLELFKSNE